LVQDVQRRAEDMLGERNRNGRDESRQVDALGRRPVMGRGREVVWLEVVLEGTVALRGARRTRREETEVKEV
jgi:hypothetical protein